MKPAIRICVLVVAMAWGFYPDRVRAGMPSLTLADVPRTVSLSNLTRQRLESISFFLLVFFLAAGLVRLAWNTLRRDIPALPRLSYGKALALVFLWGLLFVLVLTMISGARELMTPGAWEKRGVTYRLVDDQPSLAEQQIARRTEAMEHLGRALWDYAGRHGGNFPAPVASDSISRALWVVPDSQGREYLYVGGRRKDDEFDGPLVLVAYEPDVFGPDRLVIRNDGAVFWMPIGEIEAELNSRPH